MRKQLSAKNTKSMIKMGTMLLLAIYMMLQAVGCSSSGTSEKKTPVTSAETKLFSDKTETTNKKNEALEADKTESDTVVAADVQETQLQEGDSGTEAQPGVPLKAGNKAPDFTAQLIDGSSITLSDFKGKPVIINFWATWCGPCVKEMPAFERLQADFGDDIGIIAVNCGDDADTVKDFVSDNGYTFPIALDEDYKINMLYPTSSIPYTVVLDANGKITHVSAGAVDADTMYEKYKEALGV